MLSVLFTEVFPLQASERCGGSPNDIKVCKKSSGILNVSKSLAVQDKLILRGSMVLSAQIELFSRAHMPLGQPSIHCTFMLNLELWIYLHDTRPSRRSL